MKTYLLKLDDAVYAEWHRQAERNRMKLAEWIRAMCNAGIGLTKHGDRSTHDAGRARGSAPRGRRARVATGGIKLKDRVGNTAIVHTSSVVAAAKRESDIVTAAERTTGVIPTMPAGSARNLLEHSPNCPCGVCTMRRGGVVHAKGEKKEKKKFRR